MTSIAHVQNSLWQAQIMDKQSTKKAHHKANTGHGEYSPFPADAMVCPAQPMVRPDNGQPSTDHCGTWTAQCTARPANG